MTAYLAPYTLLKDWLNRQAKVDEERFDIKYDDIIELIRQMIRPVPVDEAWYFLRHPGVARAVADGGFTSAADHFRRHGYFEGAKAKDEENPTLPRFSTIKALLTTVPARGSLRVHITREDLYAIVRTLLAAVPLDEAWYHGRYQGVAEAIAAGKIKSAASHFVEHGYFENRMPFCMTVDEEWYCERYPHVQAMIADGKVETAQDHFLRFGYGQGCLPFHL